METTSVPPTIRSTSRLPAYRLSAQEVLAELQSKVEAGLTTAEAADRRSQYGANEIQSEKAIPGWRKFLAQFTDILVILLLVAASISAIIWWLEGGSGLPYEAITIFAIVLLNAVMGYLQQSRAEQAVAALRKLSASNADVIRDGARVQLPASQVVPGDIILIEEGATIPADARLLESTGLQVAQAALTGESLPTNKDVDSISEPNLGPGDQKNMVFSGTAATYGRGIGIVTAIGMGTEMGRIAGMLQETKEEITPLQRELNSVGRLLGIIVVVIAAVMISTILIFEDIQGASGIFQVLILGVALAVAAVPEGLPVIVTSVLSMGVQRMAKAKAIVRHLSAIETLGSANVIASDKTGTLTRNEMTVREFVTAGGKFEVNSEVSNLSHEIKMAVAISVSANNADISEDTDDKNNRLVVMGDPTEGALIVAASRLGFKKTELNSEYVRVGEVPFSSDRKLMSTVHQIKKEGESATDTIVFTKGAPDILLNKCAFELVDGEIKDLNEDRRRQIMHDNDEMAGRALRTLGLAYRSYTPDNPEPDWSDVVNDTLEKDLIFVGLVGMIDPPREEAKVAVEQAKSAGIRVIMITGDHPRTALVIAQEIGIASRDDKVVSGSELESMSDAELDEAVKSVPVYARVNPSHKLRIVNSLQKSGLTVAMTGDGVNDAPALKRADIGVAMGITGTDVSKEASDMILADDNFATIVLAVEEGRSIFENIRKFLRYLLSSNIGEVMTMFFGVLFANAIGLTSSSPESGLILPLLATQILWINLVTDGAPALALGLDPADHNVMSYPPRLRSERAITPKMWRGIIFVGAIMAIGTLGVLDASLPGGFFEGDGSLKYGQTMAFTTLMMFQVFNVLNARSDDRSAFSQLFTNRWLWMALGLSLILHVGVVYLPFLQKAFSTVDLSAADWLLCVGVASSVLWARELVKLARRFN